MMIDDDTYTSARDALRAEWEAPPVPGHVRAELVDAWRPIPLQIPAALIWQLNLTIDDALLASQIRYMTAGYSAHAPARRRGLDGRWRAWTLDELRLLTQQRPGQIDHGMRRLRKRGLIDWRVRGFAGVPRRHVWCLPPLADVATGTAWYTWSWCVAATGGHAGAALLLSRWWTISGLRREAPHRLGSDGRRQRLVRPRLNSLARGELTDGDVWIDAGPPMNRYQMMRAVRVLVDCRLVRWVDDRTLQLGYVRGCSYMVATARLEGGDA